MGLLQDVFGSKPTVPTWQVTPLAGEQRQAVKNNQAALPSTERLVSDANLFSQGQIDKMLKGAMPGFDQIKSAASSNILSQLNGEIPKDVAQAIERSGAAAALTGGFGGTGASRNLVARDLGLTSLQLTQQGLNSAESWMKTANSIYAPGMLNVSSMFVTPSQQAAYDTQQEENVWNSAWLSNQIGAQPDPATSGIFKMGNSMISGAMSGGGGM